MIHLREMQCYPSFASAEEVESRRTDVPLLRLGPESWGVSHRASSTCSLQLAQHTCSTGKVFWLMVLPSEVGYFCSSGPASVGGKHVQQSCGAFSVFLFPKAYKLAYISGGWRRKSRLLFSLLCFAF